MLKKKIDFNFKGCTIFEIGPKEAAELLRANPSNRRLNPTKLALYTADMLAGRWVGETWELLKFSRAGRCLDGQHRLHAIIKSGVTLPMQIATGVEESVMPVLDTGKPRNASDVFRIKGIKQDNAIPSMINNYYLLKTGGVKSVGSDKQLTHAQLLERYDEEPERWQTIAAKSMAWYKAFAQILRPSIIGGFYPYLSEIGEIHAEAFFEQTFTGLNITNQVITLFRNKLVADRMAIRRMPTPVKNALLIKTWNYFRRNEEPKILTFNPLKDNYPVAK